MVLPWDVCYVVQFNWLRRDLFDMCNLYVVLSLASSGNDVILRHCTCFRLFHDRRGALIVCIKFACLSCHSFRSFYMVDGGKSCFRSSERKVVPTPPLPTVVAALKLQASSKDKSLPGFLTAGSIASI